MANPNLKTCKKCGDKINLTIAGMHDDICWGCLSEPKKEDVTDKAVRTNLTK